MKLFPLLTPAGSDRQVQYNDGGLFGGDNSFTFNDTTKALTIAGASVVGLNSAVFQPAAGGDSTTFFQVLDADGGTPIVNVDTTNERVGFFDSAPAFDVEVNGQLGIQNQPAGNTSRTTDIPIHIIENTGWNALNRPSILIENSNAGAEAVIGFRTPGTNGMYFFGLNDDDTSMKFGKSSSLQPAGVLMSINANGVGMGDTVDPQYTLHIRKDAAGATIYPLVLQNQSSVNNAAVGMYFITSTYQYPSAAITAERHSGFAELYFSAGGTGSPVERFRIFGATGQIRHQATEPYYTFHNITHEDTNGGRESRLIFKGEQSGGEQTSLFQFEASHDGAADDQLGKGLWSVNTGGGLTEALRIDSNADIAVTGSAFIDDELWVAGEKIAGSVWIRGDSTDELNVRTYFTSRVQQAGANKFEVQVKGEYSGGGDLNYVIEIDEMTNPEVHTTIGNRPARVATMTDCDHVSGPQTITVSGDNTLILSDNDTFAISDSVRVATMTDCDHVSGPQTITVSGDNTLILNDNTSFAISDSGSNNNTGYQIDDASITYDEDTDSTTFDLDAGGTNLVASGETGTVTTVSNNNTGYKIDDASITYDEGARTTTFDLDAGGDALVASGSVGTVTTDEYYNTFKWSDDGGGTWDETGVETTRGHPWYGLNNDVEINFLAGDITTDAFVVGDQWTFTAKASPTVPLNVDTTNNETTIGGSAVLGLNSAVFQPAAGGDSTTFFQMKQADGTAFFISNSILGRIGIGGPPDTGTERTLTVHGNIFLPQGGSKFYAPTGYIDTNHYYIRTALQILNKAGTEFFPFATRNVTGVEAVVDLSNIGSIAATGNAEWTSTSPYNTLHNSTHEDSDGGRESRLIFKGEQSGGEETALFQFEASHDGAADDQLGKGVWSVNTGAGLAEALRIDSNLLATLAGALHITGDVGFYNTAPVAQEAHIVDADGTLADITTKFNALLLSLETYGLLAAA